jgi:hypothetical protein
MLAAAKLRITDCVRNFGVPQPTERQRIGNEIKAALIFARANFVSVHLSPSRLNKGLAEIVGSIP